MLQKILGLHNEIYGGPEFDHLISMEKLYRKMLRGINNGRQATYYTHEDIRRSFQEFIGGLFEEKIFKEGVKYLSEKTPSNVLIFDFIKDIFPNAKFIFVVRDPRGIISSLQKVMHRAQMYGDDVEVGKDLFTDIFNTFKHLASGEMFFNQNRNKCYRIYYEDMVNNPKGEIQKLCTFLKVPFSEKMLETNTETEGSELLGENNKTTRAWYTKEMYDRHIDSRSESEWKVNLSYSHQLLINDFFSHQNLESLERYNLNHQSTINNIYIALLNARHRSALKQLRKKVRRLSKPDSL